MSTFLRYAKNLKKGNIIETQFARWEIMSVASGATNDNNTILIEMKTSGTKNILIANEEDMFNVSFDSINLK